MCLTERGSKKDNREVAAGEAGREPGYWTHSLQGRVKPNAACTVAAGVTWEGPWRARICPVVESVITVDMLWGSFPPKGKPQPCSPGDLGLDVGMAEAMDAEERGQ